MAGPGMEIIFTLEKKVYIDNIEAFQEFGRQLESLVKELRLDGKYKVSVKPRVFLQLTEDIYKKGGESND